MNVKPKLSAKSGGAALFSHRRPSGGSLKAQSSRVGRPLWGGGKAPYKPCKPYQPLARQPYYKPYYKP